MNISRIIGGGLIGLGLGLLIGVATSCTTTQVIDALGALTNQTHTITPPVVVTPPSVEPVAVPVDVSGMTQTTPLIPKLGNTDEEVDATLYARWKSGIEDACGGLPGDVRPLFIRLNGKTFGWKYAVISGDIKVSINGDRMTVYDGKCEGLTATIQGGSDHEMPMNGKPETLEDWTPIKSGVEGVKKHFIYFKCWK